MKPANQNLHFSMVSLGASRSKTACVPLRPHCGQTNSIGVVKCTTLSPSESGMSNMGKRAWKGAPCWAIWPAHMFTSVFTAQNMGDIDDPAKYKPPQWQVMRSACACL